MTTDTDGRYQILSLSPGEYRVTTEKTGFQRSVNQGLQLQVAATAELNITLSVGNVQQTVEVTADASVVQADRHLMILLRYVERNALTAQLVKRAEDWEWGSLRWRLRGNGPIALTPSPVVLPLSWPDYVNEPQTSAELEAIRMAIARQAPYGDESWSQETATAFGLEQTLAPRGRPRKPIVTTK